MSALEKTKIFPGVTLLTLQSEQFKTGYFSVTLLRPLGADNAAKDAVLPRILRRGCRAYPDRKSLSAHLDELYGVSIEPVIRQRGEVIGTGFAASFVEDRYLPERVGTMEKTIGLTARLLLDPLTRDGLLSSEYVNSERDVLCDEIRSVLNNKRSYALRRLREIMFAGENYANYAYGTLETAKKLHYVSLTEYYRRLLAGSEIVLFYCGARSRFEVELAVREAFAALPRGELDPPVGTEVRLSVAEEKSVTEEMDVSQGNLVMGFRLGEIMYRPDYAALLLFNTVYGGGAGSKLFNNVREKLSLCYYASSSLDPDKGAMTVSAGIEAQNEARAREEILAQLEACRRGEISGKEFEAARRYVSATLRAYRDNPSLLDDFYLTQQLRELRCELDDFIALVELVKPEELIRVAESIRLDTVYFLKPREGGESHEADDV